MEDLNDEFIETTFPKIRASFEKNDNEYGLAILDSYEDRWNAIGSLSDSQVAWLQRQLDGSWRRQERPATIASKSRFDDLRQEGDFTKVSAQGIDQLIDVMVRQKLAEDGKALVDLARLNELERAIDDVRRLIQSLN